MGSTAAAAYRHLSLAGDANAIGTTMTTDNTGPAHGVPAAGHRMSRGLCATVAVPDRQRLLAGP